MVCKKDTLYTSIYKQIEACKDYTLDEYWIHIFDMCSKGKFPKGVRLLKDHGTLVVTDVHKKRKNYQLPTVVNDEYEELFVFLLTIFKEDLGLYSDTDKRELWNTYHAETPEPTIKSWNDIKSKSIREKMLQDYVLRMTKNAPYTVEDVRRILNSLYFHIIMGKIGSENITIENERIKTINNISIKGVRCIVRSKTKQNEARVDKSESKKKWLECEKFIKFRNKVIPKPMK